MSCRFTAPNSRPAVVVHHDPQGSPRRRPRGAALLADLWTGIAEGGEPALAQIAGDVVLDLTIGVPGWEPLTRGRRLDNYLLLTASQLGQRRIPAVFGRKTHRNVSSLRVGPARYRAADVPPDMQVRASGQPGALDWKERVGEACAAAIYNDEPGTEAVLLDLAFAVSSLRNWTKLWKPTIDALGPLLGTDFSKAPRAPRDDRIVELGLHRISDDSVGDDVDIRAWWRAAET
jgi:hypothetical protein